METHRSLAGAPLPRLDGDTSRSDLRSVEVYAVDERRDAPYRDHSVVRHDGQCYFGVGMAFVEGTLWVAPL